METRTTGMFKSLQIRRQKIIQRIKIHLYKLVNQESLLTVW